MRSGGGPGWLKLSPMDREEIIEVRQQDQIRFFRFGDS